MIRNNLGESKTYWKSPFEKKFNKSLRHPINYSIYNRKIFIFKIVG